MLMPTKYVVFRERIFKKPEVDNNVVLKDSGVFKKGDVLLNTIPKDICSIGYVARFERQVVKCADCGACASTFVRTQSNWVCCSCGLVHSRLVDMGPERLLDDEGHMDQNRQRFGVGECDVPEGFKGVINSRYKDKHGRLILKQIVDIVSGMNMPEVIGAYATKMFKVYLKRFGNERMLHSPWTVTAAAVYAGMLMHEHVICQPFARTRDEVCKVAEKYRRASDFLGRSSGKNRMVRLKRVYEYTKRFQDLGLISKEISIPPLSMLNDVKKRKDVANQCRRWAIFNGCKDHTMYLSSSKSWGMDLEMRQGILTVVDIEPSLTAWKAGFQIHDMIVSLQDQPVSKNNQHIDDVFQLVQTLKQKHHTIQVHVKRATKNAPISHTNPISTQNTMGKQTPMARSRSS